MSLCNACNVRLPDEDTLKEHYKSDWHRMNAGRRAKDLPPVTKDIFEKYTERRAEEEEEALAASATTIFICDACNKKFASEGQFETHIRTKKHVSRVKELLAERAAARADAAKGILETKVEGKRESDTEDAETLGESESKVVDGEVVSSDDVIVVSSLNCLFCFKKMETLVENFLHMKEAHNFYIPDFDRLRDPEGLAEHLLSKVVEGRCLYCPTESCFSSAEAAQQHMIAKCHCRIRCETPDDYAEYADFFDFDEDELEPQDVDSSAMVVATPGGPAVITEADDLMLPSGKRLVNRRMMRYYNQYYREPDAKVTRQLELLALSYQEAGVVSMTSLAVASRSAHLGIGTRGNITDPRGQRDEAIYRRRFALQTGLAQNDLRRKYFRIQMRE